MAPFLATARGWGRILPPIICIAPRKWPLIITAEMLPDAARQRTMDDFKTNRYERATGVLTWSAAQADAFQKLAAYYAGFFGAPTTRFGLRPNAITDPEKIRQLTAFFSWSAWAASALRPHKNYSYTNNWPPESLVNNHATADTLMWSVLSLVTLLGGIGLLMAAFGRWNFLGWHGREDQRISFRPPDEVLLTPAQRACAGYFLVMALLFVMQTLLGGAARTLSRGAFKFLRLRSGPRAAVQPRAHLAPATGDFLGCHVLSGGRNFSCADDHRAGTARAGRPDLCAARRAGAGRVWQHGRRIRGHLRLD